MIWKRHSTWKNSRVIICYDVKCSPSLKQSLEQLRGAFGDKAPAQRTVLEILKKNFKFDRIALNDNLREGIPVSAVTDKSITGILT